MECLTDSGAVRVLGGALATTARGEIEAHLIGCEVCTRLLAEAARDTFTDESAWLSRLRPSLLAPDTVLADRYRVIRALGSGAMGEVYEVEDCLLAKTVALKTLNAMLSGRPGATARLKTEVAMAHRVTHPNVCRIFDLGIDQREHEGGGPIVFLTMEYLEGETISRFLARSKPPIREAMLLLTQIAEGLAAAHDVGVVHRDLKPDNVMLVPHADRGLRAVITDFGLAGTAVAGRSEVARARGFSGTLEYAAPERIAGRTATPASDVYSFGLLAQQILTGHLPPTASAAAVAAALRLGERLGWDDQLPSAYQPAWDGFVLGTLHPDPSRRFQNGAKLLEALRALPVKRQAVGRASWRRTAGLVAGAVSIGVFAFVAIRKPSPPSTSFSAAQPITEPVASASEQIETGQGDATPSWLHAPPRATARGTSAGQPQKPTRRPVSANALVVSPVPAAPGSPAETSVRTNDAASDRDIVRELRPRTRASAAEVVDPFARRSGANKGGQ